MSTPEAARTAPEGVLTIGEVARFAGVTVRAVRHYHQSGLLAEPERDASGYRRYHAEQVVTLLRIRTLAAAGVPLARIARMLEADEEEFAAGLAAVDDDLRTEIRRLQEHRRSVAALPRVAELALPTEVAAYLERLREIGVGELAVRLERDAWMILAAQRPDRVAGWIERKTADLEVAEFRELYLVLQDVAGWGPDDRRLPATADRLVAIFDALSADWQDDGRVDDRLATLIDRRTREMFPAFRRLGVLLEERGYTGWTNITRVDPR